jgi:predicted SnoaL-like aldol condensation-catalyzing enzyme
MRAATYPRSFFERLQGCVVRQDWAALDDLVASDPMMRSMRPFLAELVRGGPAPEDACAANKALVARYFEMWNRGAGAMADEVLSATYRDHEQPSVFGPAALRSVVPRLRKAYPAMQMSVEFLAVGGDLVVAQNSVRKASGPDASVHRGLSFFRVADGKLAEHWSCFPG